MSFFDYFGTEYQDLIDLLFILAFISMIFILPNLGWIKKRPIERYTMPPIESILGEPKPKRM
jgi:hypothetical protein